MNKPKRNPQILIFLSFIVVSVILGWSIPGFTDWTGTQQSKRSPLIFQFAIGLTVGGIALCLLLPWLPLASHRRESAERRPDEFSLRKVLATTAAVAIWMAMFFKFQLAASILICIGTFAWLIWFVAHNRQDRWPVAALVSCMFLPYVWLAGYDELGNLMPGLLAHVFAFPALIPNRLFCIALGKHISELFWIGALLTAVQMALGLWMIRLGPKRAIAVLVYSLLASLFGSFFLYQGVRI